MKTYQIVLHDTFLNEVKKIENFKTDDIKKLSTRLNELQIGYCENEKPEIIEKIVTSKDLKLKVLYAVSDADFCYMAVINVIK